MPRRILAIATMAGLLAIAVAGAYRVGRSQARIEVERLTADLVEQREQQRVTMLRLAEVQQQAEAAVARNAQLVGEQQRREPGPDLQRLIGLAAERLRAGVPAARLEFLLAHAAVEPVCERSLESHPLVVRTPTGTGSGGSATFFGDRVIVTGEGVSMRPANGSAATGFDPNQPVTLRFLEIGGASAVASGMLPLGRTLVIEGEEFRFAARVGRGDPPIVEVTAQRCRLP
jgi:hypothetical protein